jgi:transcriptional regulator with GAF, ATPase, and Fis domain|nr:hypothetical protein [Aeromicrobium sp.]
MTSRPDEARTMQQAAPLFGSTANRRTIDHVVRLAVEAMGVKCGSVTLANGTREFETVHATHTDAVHADSLQYELDEGPCLDAARTALSPVVANLLEDGRWPRWRPQAASLGFGSIVSAKLDVGGRQIGSLNLYGLASDQLSPLQAGSAQLLADMTSLFLDRLKVEQALMRAIETRTRIGQAQGILMERFDIGGDRAFTVLRRYSQTHNVKLRDIAVRLVDTRHDTC